MLEQWNKILQRPDFWDFSPDERAKIKGRWFDKYIVPHADFQAFSPEEQKTLTDRFNEPEDYVGYDRGMISDIISRGARGGLRLVESVGGALRMADLDPTQDTGLLGRAGKAVTDVTEKAEQKYDIFKPDIAEARGEEGFLKRGFAGAVESVAPSLAPLGVGIATGMVFGPVGAIVGGLAALFATFGLGQYQTTFDDTIKELETKGITGEEAERKAKKNALISALAESLGETAGDAAMIITFGVLGKTLVGQPLKQTIRQLMKGGKKEFGKAVAKAAPFEVGSEMGTAYFQAKAAQEAGVSTLPPGEAIAEAILPAVFLSIFFGGAVHGMQSVRARQLYSDLNSEDPGQRAVAVKEIADRMKDAEDRQTWLDTAGAYIQTGEKIPISKPIVDFAIQKTDQEAAPEVEKQAKKEQADRVLQEINAAKTADEAVAAFQRGADRRTAPSSKSPLAATGLFEELTAAEDIIGPEEPPGGGLLSRGKELQQTFKRQEDRLFNRILHETEKYGAEIPEETITAFQSEGAQMGLAPERVSQAISGGIKASPATQGFIAKAMAEAAPAVEEPAIEAEPIPEVKVEPEKPVEVPQAPEVEAEEVPGTPYSYKYEQGDLGTERQLIVYEGDKAVGRPRDPFWPAGIPVSAAARTKRLNLVAKEIIAEHEKEKKPALTPDKKSALAAEVKKVKAKAAEKRDKKKLEAEADRLLKEEAEAEAKTADTPIGKNDEGVNIYENEKGVRYIIEGEFRSVEPMTIIPGRPSVKAVPTRKSPTFLTEKERAEEAPAVKAPHKPGEKVRVMGTMTAVVDLRLIDGISYELYSADDIGDDRGYVRVFDVDSGQTVTINEYPSYRSAKSAWAEAIEKSEKPVHDYSSVQVRLPDDIAGEIRSFAAWIPDEEIYTEEGEDYGRAEIPHITVRYGIGTDDLSQIAPAFKDIGPITGTIGTISTFTNSEDYDVIKSSIESPDLEKANKAVGDTVDLPGETFKDYKPHVTIAYVKKGEGQKYVGMYPFDGRRRKFTIDQAEFSTRTGESHFIKLEKPAVVEVIESLDLQWKSFIRRLSDKEKQLIPQYLPPYRPQTRNVRTQIDYIQKFLKEKPAADISAELQDTSDEDITDLIKKRTELQKEKETKDLAPGPVKYEIGDIVQAIEGSGIPASAQSGRVQHIRTDRDSGEQNLRIEGGGSIHWKASDFKLVKPEKPAAKEALKEAGIEAVEGVKEAYKGLAELFGIKDPNILRAGIPFDEETYAKAKPHFQEAWTHAKAAGYNLVDFIDSILHTFASSVEPYLNRFVLETKQREAKDAETKPTVRDAVSGTTPVVEGPADLADGERAEEGPEPIAEFHEPEKVPGQRSDISEEGGVEAGRPEGEQEPGGRDDTRDEDKPAVAVGEGEGVAAPTVQPPTKVGGPAVRPKPKPRPVKKPKELKPEDVNHVIQPEDELFLQGKITRGKANVKAIRLLRKLQKEKRNPTSEEKKTLAQFSGWGDLSETVFNIPPYQLRAKERGYMSGKDWNKVQSWKKHFGALHPEVGGLLSEEEWEAAKASTLNAHYTSREVISSGLWPIAERLGFKGGTVLEPAAGVGHILGLIPEDLKAKTKLVGVEIEPISAGILEKLYPQADIFKKGFEDVNIQNNTVDLTITNVPFGDYKVTDKNHPNYNGWSIHNYFFARALDAVKPGGLVIAITSRYSLDGSNSLKMREYMTERADFVGAIRLPKTAFAESAGTEVVTDILVFRKHDEQGQVVHNDFRTLKDIKIGKEETIHLNEYIVDHPEMVLGKHSMTGSMYGGDEYTVEPDKTPELEYQIAARVKEFPENIMSKKDSESIPGLLPAPEGEKEGQLVWQGGKAYVVVSGNLVSPGWGTSMKTPAAKKKIQQYIKVRESMKELIKLQLDANGVEQELLDKARADFNKEYDKFHKDFGPVSSSPQLRKDVEYPMLAAAEDRETIREEKTVKGKKKIVETTKYSKSEIFFKRTQFPFVEPEKADSVEDALQISLSYRNNVNLPLISKLVDNSPDEVKANLIDAGLVFEDPENGLLFTVDEYLSGNIKTKLEAAKAAGKNFESNVKALEDSMPDPLVIDDIHFRLGSSWVPEKAISEFAVQLLGIPRVEIKKMETSETVIWTVDAWGSGTKNTITWGVDNLTGDRILEKGLNSRTPEIFIPYTDENGKPKRRKDKMKSLQAQDKLKQMNDEFRTWVRNNHKVADEMTAIYNDNYNIFKERTFSVPKIKHYPGAAISIELRDHQKRAVSRGLSESTLFAHAPGTGKTYVYITTAMEMRRLGIAKKPMIVVQSSTMSQYLESFNKLYPSARILIPDDAQRAGKADPAIASERKKVLAQITTGDWDAVILPHKFFDDIANDPEREAAYIREQLAELETFLIERRESEGKNAPTVKELEKQKKRYVNKLKNLLDLRADEAIWFEDMGVDALLIDEAHEYKRGDFLTNLTRVKGIDQGSAAKSTRFFLKSRFVREKTGGKNIQLATGTPISNTMAELWTLFRYTRPDLLEQFGVSSFDSFASMFGDIVSEPVEHATGSFRMESRFMRYVNGPELLKMWLMGADVILPEDVKDMKEPKIKGGEPTLIAIKRSKLIGNMIQDIRDRWTAWEELPGREKMMQRHVPLVLYGEANKLTVDPRLVAKIDPTKHQEEGVPFSKLEVVADEVYKIWKKSTPKLGTQFVFSDPKRGPGGFNLRTEFLKMLEDKGIPRSELVDIDNYNTDKTRVIFLEKFRSGEFRVVIGHTKTLGMGTDAARLAVAAHHIDAPIRPMDFEQRNKRVVRQGNENDVVELLTYGTIQTLDSRTYDILQKKQKFINQVMRGKIGDRSFDDPGDEVQISFQEAQALFSGNPLIRDFFKAQNELKTLKVLQTGFNSQQSYARRELNRKETTIIGALERNKERAIKRSEGLTPDFPENKVTKLVFDGETLTEDIRKRLDSEYESRSEAVENRAKALIRDKDKLMNWILSREYVQDEFQFEVNGHDIYAKVIARIVMGGVLESIEERAKSAFFDGVAGGWSFDAPFDKDGFDGEFGGGRAATGSGFITSLRNYLETIHERPERIQEDLDYENNELKDLKEQVKKSFSQADRLIEVQAEYDRLEKELGIKDPNDPLAGHVAPVTEAPAEPTRREAAPEVDEEDIEVPAPTKGKWAQDRQFEKRDYDDELTEVTGEISGFFGIELDKAPGKWAVTHIPTGMALKSNMASREKAQEYAEAMGSKDEIWDFTDKENIPDEVQRRNSEVLAKQRYAETPAGPVPITLTREDVQRIFKGQRVLEADDGVVIQTTGKQYLQIKDVEQITPDEIDYKMAWGKEYSGHGIAGVYKDGVIKLSRTKRGVNKYVLRHEQVHWLEDIGILSITDISLLRSHIRKLSLTGDWKTKTPKDIGGEEDRAWWISNQLEGVPGAEPTQPKIIDRVISKIREWIDRLVNIFDRTAGGVVRDIEEGKIFEAVGEPEPGELFAPTAQYAPADIDPIIKEVFDTHEKSTIATALRGVFAPDKRTRAKAKEHISDLRTQTLDRLHPIEQLGRQPYILHRLLGNAHIVISTFLEHGMLSWLDQALTVKTKNKGFLPWLENLGDDGRKLFYWIAVKRAETLEREGRENWLTETRREEVLNSIFKDLGPDPRAREAKEAKFEKLNLEFQKWNQNILDIAKESGLLNDEQIDSWERDFYLPFYRLLEDETTKEDFLKGPTRSKRHISAQIRRLKGGEEQLGDPIENILRNWSHLIQESQREMARGEAFDSAIPMGLITIVPNSELVKILGSRTIKQWGVKKEGAKRASRLFDSEDEAGLYLDKMESKRGPTDPPYEIVERKTTQVNFGRKEDFQILSHQRNGETEYGRVADPDLFEAMSEINTQPFDSKIMKIFGTSKRILTVSATFGPAFRIANILRDTLHTAVVSPGFTPFIDSARGVIKVWQKSPEYIAVMASGSGFGKGWVDSGDPKAQARAIDKIVRSEGKQARNWILDTPRKIWDFWDRIGHASEMAARVQKYSKMMAEENGNHLESAYEARDLLDFHRTGAANSVRVLVATVPFLNARIQGMDRMYRGAKDNKLAFFTKGALVASASLMLWGLFKDDDRYKELEDWDKWQYHHFWIGKQHFRLPKAFEVGAIFSSLFETAANVIDGQEGGKFFLAFIAHSLFQTFAMSPPTAVAPLIEIFANKSFFTGRPIENLSMQRLPVGDRARPWTPEILQALGRGQNLISPVKMETLIRGYTATIGTVFVTLVDAMYRLATDAPDRPAWRIQDMPGIGRFARADVGGTKYSSRYYDFARDVEELVGTLRNYKAVGEYDKAREMTKKLRNKLRFKSFLNATNRRLSVIRKKEKLIWISRTMEPGEKRRRLDDLQVQKNDVYLKAYQRMK